jgi:uncharacterized protein YciI
MNEAHQFLYKIRPTRAEMLSQGATQDETEIVSAHFNYLKGLHEQGILVLAGRTLNTDETSFGIVIFNAKTVEKAREIMENDPAVLQGVLQAELYPYRMALMIGS